MHPVSAPAASAREVPLDEEAVPAMAPPAPDVAEVATAASELAARDEEAVGLFLLRIDQRGLVLAQVGVLAADPR